jgi:hypothetical protein
MRVGETFEPDTFGSEDLDWPSMHDPEGGIPLEVCKEHLPSV